MEWGWTDPKKWEFKKERKKFPGTLPFTNPKTGKYIFQREDRSGGRLAEWDKQHLPSLSRQGDFTVPSTLQHPAWCPTTSVTPWTPWQGTDAEEGPVLPGSNSCLATQHFLSEGPAWLLLRSENEMLTKRFCPVIPRGILALPTAIASYHVVKPHPFENQCGPHLEGRDFWMWVIYNGGSYLEKIQHTAFYTSNLLSHGK